MLMKRRDSKANWKLEEDVIIIACWNASVSDQEAEKILKEKGFERTSVSIGSRRRRKLYNIEKIDDLASIHSVKVEEAQQALDNAVKVVEEVANVK